MVPRDPPVKFKVLTAVDEVINATSVAMIR